jgi:FkbM family methyltransferase
VTSFARATYQFTASACADLMSRVPALEPAFIRAGSHLWHWRATGHFYRSVAGRYAQRLRESGSPFRRVMIGDVPLLVDVSEFTTSPLYFGNVPYEPKTTEYLRRHLRSGDVFADIGANHGFFTILAAGLVGEGGLVFAFEPNPPVYERLGTHVRLNGFEHRVVLREQALWDSNGEAAFFVSQWRENNGISTLTPGASVVADGGLSPERTIRVRTETFDHWLGTNRIERVHLVKIDAEGSEAHVVRGMAGALQAGRIDAVVCETEWHGEAHRLLCGFGFIPQALDTIGPLTNIAYAR